MKHNMTLKQAYKYWDAMSPPEFKEGDTIEIIPERNIVDLSRVVGTSIPMLFSSEHYDGLIHCRLKAIDSNHYIDADGGYGQQCTFDTSENNWVSWGKHVPWYDGQCPVPYGVEFEVLLRDLKAVCSDDFDIWAHCANPVIAFRITGLKKGWRYEWEGNDE